jgi:hypothetical protein
VKYKGEESGRRAIWRRLWLSAVFPWGEGTRAREVRSGTNAHQCRANGSRDACRVIHIDSIHLLLGRESRR